MLIISVHVQSLLAQTARKADKRFWQLGDGAGEEPGLQDGEGGLPGEEGGGGREEGGGSPQAPAPPQCPADDPGELSLTPRQAKHQMKINRRVRKKQQYINIK